VSAPGRLGVGDVPPGLACLGLAAAGVVAAAGA
jgi:hypothetical protein